MNGRKPSRLGSITAAAVALAVGVVLLASTRASAQQELITIESAAVAPGAEGSVRLDALGIAAPGLGAWTMDISYDPVVLTALACIPEHGGVCNPMFDVGVVRVTGASAGGVAGDKTLATITFRCNVEGSSALTLNVPLLVDATIGNPQLISALVQSGSIACTTTAPSGGDVFSCSDFVYQDTAQAILQADPSDPHNLDPDGNGIACETLPPRPDTGDGAVTGFPDVGDGADGVPTVGQIVRWLTAALVGIALAGLASIGVVRLRAGRTSVERVRRS